MKSLSLIASFVALVASSYFFVADFRWATDTNYLIYMSMLLTLIFISILGIVISLPFIWKGRKKVKSIIYNSYSPQRIKNKQFDSQFGIS